MDKEQVEKLAKLSRLKLTEAELAGYLKDFNSILDYVGEINKVVTDEPPKEAGELRNVMREDGEPHESGLYTDALLDNAPKVKDGYVKVKQVFVD